MATNQTRFYNTSAVGFRVTHHGDQSDTVLQHEYGRIPCDHFGDQSDTVLQHEYGRIPCDPCLLYVSLLYM